MPTPLRTWIVLLAVASFFVITSDTVAEENHPRKVVSLNLCTDQLAMMLASPGQLYSVTWLAAKPDASVLADLADQYVLNHGLAEEILLMKPDLVLAGTYTSRATVTLLKRLGFQVEEFEPANSFQKILANIRRLASLLGNKAKGEEMIRQFNEETSRIGHADQQSQRVALYYANSYTSGAGTLADEVISAAGLTNIGREIGYAGTTKLPLELLVTTQPDIVAGRARNAEVNAKSEEVFLHPAYHALLEQGQEAVIDQEYWICGGPFTLNAVRTLNEIIDENADE